MWIAHQRKNLISVFQENFTSTNKIFISDEDLAKGNNSMKFWGFPDISKFPRVLSLKSGDFY